VGGEFLLGDREKEMFVRMMWRVAEFLRIEILDYVIMSNHYHQLIRVPGVVELNDEQLHERIKAYYGEESLEVLMLEEAMAEGGDALESLKKRHLERMGNVSEFEKILKQGFSIWYNKRNNRRGTLWMERFKSVLVEDTLAARQIMATYIDLNPVRAEMVSDPKNYRFCGYAAALGCDKRCRDGIKEIMGISNWKGAASAYRMVLLQRGNTKVHGKKGAISRGMLLETFDKEGTLSQAELIRLKVRYFSDGLVLGSELFVEDVFEQYRSHFGEKRKSGSRSIRGFVDSPLRVIRDLKVDPIS
jgi:REP element-mobilizing transposase RayT